MKQLTDFLFRFNPEPAWIFDRETLRFLAVNEAAVQRYGYTEDEFLGMTIADIRPTEDVPRLMAFLAVERPSPQDAGRWRHRLKSGEIITVEVRAFPLGYMDRPAEIVTTRDATAMQRFEEAEARRLQAEREAAALLAMAGRVARFGGWRVDLLKSAVIWSDETAAIHEVTQTPKTPEAGLVFYIPEHRPIIDAAFRACVDDGIPFDLILQIVTGRGRRLWVRAIGEPERDAKGRIVAVWGAFQDVDELIRARADSEATQKRLSDTLNASAEAFMVLDDRWRFTFLNDAATDLLRRSRDDLMGKTLWEEFPEAVGSGFETGYTHAVRTGEPVSFEEFFEPLDGWFEVRAYPAPDGLAVHFQNITERRRAVEALRASEERFRLVATVTNDVIWDWDFPTDEIWWNEHMEAQFGHGGEISRNADFWARHVHPDDRERVLTRIRAAIAGAATEWSDEYRFLKADASEAHVIDRGLIIRDSAGVALRMLGSMVDVSRRLATEAQLREAQKLEAVGKLTGGIAHDFNNLLTVIIGTAESLTERLSDDAESVMLAEMTAAAAERGAELTSRLLAFARKQPLAPRPTDIARLVNDFDPIMRRTLRDNIDIEVVRGGGLWRAMVDPGQLEAALLNLAINARDAMPEGGRLTIETGNVALDADYARSNDEVVPGQYVMLSVSDSGSGMPGEVVAQAFEPFFTTKEAGKGSGLGLSMVYGFVKQSRGHVNIYSEPGQGTTVRLYLPRAYDGSGVVEAPASLASGLPTGDERLLLVEDDPMVREHVARQLRGLGYVVTEASDGPEALARLAAGEPYDLLFTDVVMPGGMNGRELAQAAHRLRPDLKVLFTSGYTENAIVHHGRLDPGVQLLSKPYRKRDLAERVRRLLDDQ
ncbi:Blue-light-activated protein [compost metagenome]